MPIQKIVVLLGSSSDLPFAQRITEFLRNENLQIEHEYRVDSAHRNPEKLLADLKNYAQSKDQIVYVTIAGLSDALSGLVAGNTTSPVIACPPDLKTTNWTKAFSTAATPTGIPVTLVSEPENAALAAAKIFALSNKPLDKKLQEHLKIMKKKVEKMDSELTKKKLGS